MTLSIRKYAPCLQMCKHVSEFDCEYVRVSRGRMRAWSLEGLHVIHNIEK
jgi:hypothetical protein